MTRQDVNRHLFDAGAAVSQGGRDEEERRRQTPAECTAETDETETDEDRTGRARIGGGGGREGNAGG